MYTGMRLIKCSRLYRIYLKQGCDGCNPSNVIGCCIWHNIPEAIGYNVCGFETTLMLLIQYVASLALHAQQVLPLCDPCSHHHQNLMVVVVSVMPRMNTFDGLLKGLIKCRECGGCSPSESTYVGQYRLLYCLSS